jgi:glucan phosphoethanolaminetransferase (alkaline phosphatase superfamily)
LVSRAFSVLMAGALAGTLAAKFFHSWRYGMTAQYLSWVMADIAVLLGIEAVLALACFLWPRRGVVRGATIVATMACSWSVINAGWLIRTGTQVFPQAILPLIHDPLNISLLVAVNLIKNPFACVALVVPSLLALGFVGLALARPKLPHYRTLPFLGRIAGTLLLASLAVPARGAMIRRIPSKPGLSELQYNSQLRAVTSLVVPSAGLREEDFLKAGRELPTPDQVRLTQGAQARPLNVVMVIFEGIGYEHTSLAEPYQDRTPFLRTLAKQGVEFAAMRSTVTHTTKAMFALLMGRCPSASQDTAEVIPSRNGYASLATILSQQRGYRTALFTSAKGSFESGPSLVRNLGFDCFWARECLNDPSADLGYLASDEFTLLRPIREWLTADSRPFLLTIMCSVSHDPYEVPSWYSRPAKEPLDRYRQTVAYTDTFLAALDKELASLGLTGNTIFCAVSDHGEAFGEHGRRGHDLIGFEEALHVPWVMRGPSPIVPGTRITWPTSSIDVTPTLLALLGFKVESGVFEGQDALDPAWSDRKVYFSCWANEGPAGFVRGSLKYVYWGSLGEATVYDLSADPGEVAGVDLAALQAQTVAFDVLTWRRSTLFWPDQQPSGKAVVYGTWLCKWAGRDSTAKYERASN